jgi:flavin reductase (DIM6/NTAB) family NADH-FMN oxidoreductase RutF
MDAISKSEFRRVLSHLPTGVTVITADTPDGPAGMAANSVTSLSLDPPMILFCPARSSKTWPRLRTAGRVCVNVLGGSAAELTRQFARKRVDRFAGVSWRPWKCGPALEDAVAWIGCRVNAEHDGGDHTIVTADVLALETAPPREPLVFFRGVYGTFAVTGDASH